MVKEGGGNKGWGDASLKMGGLDTVIDEYYD